MEPLHYLALAGQDFDAAHSALPQAPTVECDPRPQRTRAVRGAIAHSLHRLGDAVAPASANTAGPVAA
jgi:hypothetical protein